MSTARQEPEKTVVRQSLTVERFDAAQPSSEAATEKAPVDYVRELNSFPDLVLLVEAGSMVILDVNEHAAQELGWTVDEMMGKPLSAFGDPGDRELNPTLIAQALEGYTVHFDRRVRTALGDWRHFNFAARFVGAAGTRFLLVGREMEALAHSHSQLADLLKLANLTDDIFVVCDRDGYVTYANAATARIHGDLNFVGRHLTDFVHEDDEGYPDLLSAIKSVDGRADARVIAKLADGNPIHLDVRTIYDRATQRWFTVERDISAAVAQEERMDKLTAELRRQAKTDELTGVANRVALNEVLDFATRTTQDFALLVLDMDDFKSVNDTFGHAAGDMFLRCVANRIEQSVKSTDTVARIGGDEFVVFLPGLGGARASDVADRIIDSVSRPYSISGESITRSCSIGIALYEPGDDPNAVLRKADRALYRSKHAGRACFALY